MKLKFDLFLLTKTYVIFGLKIGQNFIDNKLKIVRGWLAQIVERALWKFSPQREVIRTPPVPGFFSVELKYIPLRRDLESSKNATEFGHVSTSENQSVFTVK